MTFSLAVHDAERNAFGIVITSSSPAVAARCAHLRAGVGAVSTQNVTNPALGPAMLDAMAASTPAPDALVKVLAEESYPEHRQLIAVDTAGRTAVFTGSRALGIHHAVETCGAAAAGNLLARGDVIDALVEGYESCDAETLEVRLLQGLEAAFEAGGESGPLHSAGLFVVEDVLWATTDLRIDWSADPIGDLRALWSLWSPQKMDYRRRALDPTRAPSYGVPGNE